MIITKSIIYRVPAGMQDTEQPVQILFVCKDFDHADHVLDVYMETSGIAVDKGIAVHPNGKKYHYHIVTGVEVPCIP